MGPVWPKRALSAAIVRSQTRCSTWPPADRVTRDHGDDRLGEPADLDLEVEDVQPADAALGHLVVAEVAVVAADPLVAPGAEGVRALAGQDDDADLRVVAADVEGARQLEERLGTEGVAHLGPADGELRDPLCGLVADVLELAMSRPFGGGHGCTLIRARGDPRTLGRCAASWPSRCPAAPQFVEALRRCWDAGDAVLPLDLRLAKPARQRLLDALRPAVVLDESGSSSHARGGRAGRGRRRTGRRDERDDRRTEGSGAHAVGRRGLGRATSARLGVDPARDRWLACLPLAHVGGLSVVTRAMVTGTPVEIQPRFAVDEARRAAMLRGATLVSLVPAALGRLGPEGAELFRVDRRRRPAAAAEKAANVVATYGMTETGSGVVYDGVALKDVEVRIDAGEILLRCPMLLRCYRDGTDPKTPDGWFATGDAGALDESGRLKVHGRLDDVVISGGENIWPVQVEAVLRTHPGVADVAVGGRPDLEWGARLVAYVVPSVVVEHDEPAVLLARAPRARQGPPGAVRRPPRDRRRRRSAPDSDRQGLPGAAPGTGRARGPDRLKRAPGCRTPQSKTITPRMLRLFTWLSPLRRRLVETVPAEDFPPVRLSEPSSRRPRAPQLP